MIPWQTLDKARAPGGEELRLIRRGGEFAIMLGANPLMNSRLFGSEEALASLAFEKVGAREAARVLIGGLGMGFTLRAALRLFGADARIEVAELVPAIVDWARGPMAELFAGCLDDPRVAVHVGDVGALIAKGKSAWDAILLDVDNGPEGLTRQANDALYGHRGLAEARRKLTPRGALLVWSQGPDERFARRFREAGFAVEEKIVRANGAGKGAKHTIWVGAKA
jgi:spermidine synthase